MIRGFIIQRNNFKLYTNFNTKKVLLNLVCNSLGSSENRNLIVSSVEFRHKVVQNYEYLNSSDLQILLLTKRPE